MTVSPVPRTIEWVGGLDGHVALVDQTLLPTRLEIARCDDVETVWEAIRCLRVRGAPAIGIAAAMGLVLGVRHDEVPTREAFLSRIADVSGYLASARPTAVNLTWALERMRRRLDAVPDAAAVPELKQVLLAEATAIRDEDAAMCRAIGAVGAPLIRPECGVLTYCNAGGLATAEYGTALAPMYTAHAAGCRFRVYAPETRPLLQGSRLTAWELSRAGIDVTVLCDGMVAALMQSGRVDLVITGADRIARNGDTANKIGTYAVAVLAEAHGIPFYVAAPSSTFDLALEDGRGIPIEQRPATEVRCGFGAATAPEDVPCFNPAFDVTPARLIRGIVTERGMIEPVGASEIPRILG